MAATALTLATERGSDLCGPFVSAISVSGAAITTLGDPLGTQTVCASDPTAARIDEIQADLGEGPCWDAHASGEPVLEADLQDSNNDTWPVARAALKATGIGALFAFPLSVGGLRIGSIDLYVDSAGELSSGQMDDTVALASIAARQVLRRALNELDLGTSVLPPGPYSRREVHQATGMVSAQMKITVDDAAVVLRGHAFASGRSLREVASDVVSRRLNLSE